MTILDRQVTSKGKEENGQNRQANQEKSGWSQRARQSHNQRGRVSCLHRRDQPIGASSDYGYWRNSRKDVSHCEANTSHHESTRDDVTARGHIKPKGLSKSSSSVVNADDLLSGIGKLKKDELQSTRETSSSVIPKTHEMNSPTTSNSCSKIVGRINKKNGDKKVIHCKRKHRRNGPYNHHSSKGAKHATKTNCSTFPSKLPQHPVEECSAVVHKDPTNPLCQYKTSTLMTDKNQYSDQDAVYNSRHFSTESSNFMRNASHQDEYASLSDRHQNPRGNNNSMGENCRNMPGFNDEKAESENSETRHNSDDEYDQTRLKRLNHGINFKELEEQFAEELKKVRGFKIKPMVEDGACLFRAVADQVYGDQDMHDEVRKNCMNYMMKNADYYSNYVTEDFNSYINRKRELHTFGNHLEMQAMAEMYNRPFEVYQYTTEPINTFQTSHVTSNPPIRVSYHENSHYNSVVDPYKATIGVGLGLPSFKPGMVENRMLEDAMKASEDVWEQQMLNDKVVATDWEATDDAILEQIARESYMEYIEEKTSKIKEDVKHTEPKKTPPRELCSPTAELSTKTYSPKTIVKEFPKKSNRSLTHSGGDWVAEDEEWEVLSQVLANSQQEYMDVLKQQATQSKATCSKYT